MLELKNKAVAELGGPHDVIVEASPVNGHQSDGVVERSVQTDGGVIRARKLPLEQSSSKKLEADHVVIPWLIMHAAVMVSLFQIGSDGRTTHARSRSKPNREITYYQ